MKCLIFLLAVSCSVIPINGQTSRENPNSHQKKSQEPKGRAVFPNTTPVNIDTVNVAKINVPEQPNSSGTTDKNSDQPPSYFHRLIAPETLPNVLLCVVGFLGIGAAYFTLREMKKATEIQTKTLVLQYRPRIIVRNAKAFDFHVAELGKSANGKVEFTIVNIGETKAKITEGNVFMMVAKSPKDTERGRDYPISAFILQPGEDKPLTVNMDDITNDLRFSEFSEARGLGQIKSVYLCGKIRYFDDNSIPRSARFKRKYEPSEGRFIPDANPDEEYAD